MAISKEVTNPILVLLTRLERYHMKQLIADLLYQVLIDLLSQMLMRLAEWMAVVPWL